MKDITVIILTFNEEKHIARCIGKIGLVAKNIFIVDCYSKDFTAAIAKKLGAHVFLNEWPGSQAAQFNWALQNLPIQTEWILRLDADEYLLPELIQEIEDSLASLSKDVSGIVFKRRLIFQGKWIK